MTPTPTSKDRRRDYERRHRMLGLCQKCSARAVENDRCFRHLLIYMLSKRKLTHGVLNKINTNRREKLIASLHGRYQAIVSGMLKPSTEQEATQQAQELRQRLNIGWGGIRGLQKTAQIIMWVEKHASRLVKETA